MATSSETSRDEGRGRRALLLTIPEVDALVGDHRRRYTEDGRSVPPHITLMHPFYGPGETTPPLLERLTGIIAGVPPFRASLSRLASFPTGQILYLEPEPAAPIVRLISRLRLAFPDIAPYWDDYDRVVPHLTVADLALADRPGLREEIASSIAPALPIPISVQEVTWLQRLQPPPAPWSVRARFQMKGSEATPTTKQSVR